MDENANKFARKLRRRLDQHKLSHMSTGRGKWNGSKFRRKSQPYQKHKCSCKCNKIFRIDCSCDRNVTLFTECYALNKVDNY